MERSEVIVRVAGIVLRHRDKAGRVDAMRAEFAREDWKLAFDILISLIFLEAEMGRAEVERVRDRHATLAPL